MLQRDLDCDYNVITMRAEIVRIGNSRGIRIPKLVIEECGFGEKVEIKVENRRLIVSRESRPREGWEQMFHSAGDSKTDERPLEIVSNEFDRTEWTW
jgi:antitoxin MazE